LTDDSALHGLPLRLHVASFYPADNFLTMSYRPRQNQVGVRVLAQLRGRGRC